MTLQANFEEEILPKININWLVSTIFGTVEKF